MASIFFSNSAVQRHIYPVESPNCVKKNDKYYFVYPTGSGGDLNAVVRVYDEIKAGWSDEHVVFSGFPRDTHHLPIIGVDGNNYIHVFHNVNGSENRQIKHYKSVSPNDITSWVDKGLINNSGRVYKKLLIYNNELNIFSRQVTGDPKNLYRDFSTDQNNWGSNKVLDISDGVTDYWLYPYKEFYDGSNKVLYLLVCQRIGAGSSWERLYLFKYDIANKIVLGVDGTNIGSVANHQDMVNTNSLVNSQSNGDNGMIIGSGLYVHDNGDVSVAYTNYNTSTNVHDLVHSFYDSSNNTWSSNFVDTGVDDVLGVNTFFRPGEYLYVDVVAGEIIIYETISCVFNNDTALYKYSSSDNGVTWSSKTLVKDYNSEFTAGIHGIKPIYNNDHSLVDRFGASQFFLGEQVDRNDDDFLNPVVGAGISLVDNSFDGFVSVADINSSSVLECDSDGVVENLNGVSSTKVV